MLGHTIVHSALLLSSTLAAQEVKWRQCGGSDFALCVGFSITLSGRDVTIGLWNYSGLEGTSSLASAGLFSLSLYGIAPTTLDNAPVFRDPECRLRGWHRSVLRWS